MHEPKGARRRRRIEFECVDESNFRLVVVVFLVVVDFDGLTIDFILIIFFHMHSIRWSRVRAMCIYFGI